MIALLIGLSSALSNDATLRVSLSIESAAQYTMHEQPLAEDASRVTVAAITTGSREALHVTDSFLVIDGMPMRGESAVAWTLVGDELTYSHPDTALVMRWPDKMGVGEALAIGRWLMAVQGWAVAAGR